MGLTVAPACWSVPRYRADSACPYCRGSAEHHVEPASWLLAGSSAVEFLARADVTTLLIVAVRVIHLAAVLVALALMFSSTANAFFRRTGHRPDASPSDA
jgi:hypothetical protein